MKGQNNLLVTGGFYISNTYIAKIKMTIGTIKLPIETIKMTIGTIRMAIGTIIWDVLHRILQ